MWCHDEGWRLASGSPPCHMTTGSSPPLGQLQLHSPGRATINIDLVTAHVWPRLWLVTGGGCAVSSPSSAPHFCPVLCPGLGSGHKHQPGSSGAGIPLNTISPPHNYYPCISGSGSFQILLIILISRFIKHHVIIRDWRHSTLTGAVFQTIFFIGSSLYWSEPKTKLNDSHC